MDARQRQRGPEAADQVLEPVATHRAGEGDQQTTGEDTISQGEAQGKAAGGHSGPNRPQIPALQTMTG